MLSDTNNFNIIGEWVTVKTALGQWYGIAKKFSPGSILLECNEGEDEEGDIVEMVQIIAKDMIIIC